MSITLRELMTQVAGLIIDHPEVLDMKVRMEGCDCSGLAGSVEVSEGEIFINRN